jgi:hypothetical protein
VIVVVVRCARKCAVCFFEALGAVVGAHAVDALVLVVGVAHCVAAAVAVAPGITAEWWKLRHARRQRGCAC